MKAFHRSLCASLLALPLLAVACGDDEAGTDDGVGAGQPLTCAWAEADDNCWKQSASAVLEACAPGGEVTGTLSADRKTCTFEDGTAITFAEAVPEDVVDSEYLWSFTIARGGSECASFRETEGDGKKQLNFETSLGTFTQRLDGMNMSMTCPDGATYSTSNALGLLGCEDAFSILPGTVVSGGASSVSFGLMGAAESSATLFVCESAQ